MRFTSTVAYFLLKLLNDIKNVYITNIQLYYLKLLIINIKLPDAKIIKVLFQEAQEWNKKFYEKANSDNHSWSRVRKLEHSIESRKGLLQRKKSTLKDLHA